MRADNSLINSCKFYNVADEDRVECITKLLRLDHLNYTHLKYTNLFKNMASRLIFMTIFLLCPIFSKKYENLSWKTITTRAQKRIQQEKAKNLKRNETQEKLDENFPSKPLVEKPRGRPRNNLLTNLTNIPSQTKRKRGRPRKQI